MRTQIPRYFTSLSGAATWRKGLNERTEKLMITYPRNSFRWRHRSRIRPHKSVSSAHWSYDIQQRWRHQTMMRGRVAATFLVPELDLRSQSLSKHMKKVS